MADKKKIGAGVLAAGLTAPVAVQSARALHPMLAGIRGAGNTDIVNAIASGGSRYNPGAVSEVTGYLGQTAPSQVINRGSAAQMFANPSQAGILKSLGPINPSAAPAFSEVRGFPGQVAPNIINNPPLTSAGPNWAQGGVPNSRALELWKAPAAAATDDAAAAAGRTLFPGLGKTGTQALGRAAAKQAGTKAGLLSAGGKLGAGGLGRASGYGLAGQVGSAGIDMFNFGGDKSETESTLKGAAQGAGYGAALGSIVFPGVGTAIGAGGGAILGGVIGNIKTPKTPKEKAAQVDDNAWKMTLAMRDAIPMSVGDDVRQEMFATLDQHAAQLKAFGLGAKGGTVKGLDGPLPGLEEVANQLIAQVPQLAAARQAQDAADRKAAAHQLAMQNFMTEQMKPYIERFTTHGEQAAAQYEALGRNDLAAQSRASSSRLAAAYATQASGFMNYQGLQSQLAFANQIAQRQQQQQLNAMFPSSSASESIMDVAAK